MLSNKIPALFYPKLTVETGLKHSARPSERALETTPTSHRSPALHAAYRGTHNGVRLIYSSPSMSTRNSSAGVRAT